MELVILIAIGIILHLMYKNQEAKREAAASSKYTQYIISKEYDDGMTWSEYRKFKNWE